MNRTDIYAAIDVERDRQGQLWNREHSWGYGDCSGTMPDPVKSMVLSEEAGEVARAVLERDLDGLKVELIQSAAVCVAWLESLDGAQ